MIRCGILKASCATLPKTLVQRYGNDRRTLMEKARSMKAEG
jgi:hypothetical protein